MLKGIIFDMDGVLLDSERPHVKIDIELAAEMGYTLPGEFVEKMFGATDGQIREYALEHLGKQFDCDYFSRESHRRVAALFGNGGVPVKPGARALLEALRARHIPCALASSSTAGKVRENLGRAGLLPFFEVLTGGDEAPASKPAPDIFLLSSRKLGLLPRHCLAVEDSYNGVRSAAGAGCVTVMVPDVQPPTEAMRALAAAILEDLSQVPDFYDEFNKAKMENKSK